MNITEARISAEELEKLLIKYAVVDSDAAQLLSALQPLLDKAKASNLTESLDFLEVPGSWFFSERELSRFVDLANAYARFAFAVSDGDAPHTLRALKVVRQIMSENSEPPDPQDQA